MTNSALVLTFVKPNPSEIDAFHGYVGAATELAREAGGAPSSRFGVRSVLGDAPAAVFGLATFPTAEAATTMFESDAYKALVPARDGSVQSLNAYVVDAAPVSSLPDPDGVYMIVVGAPNPEAKEDLETYQRVATQLVGKHGGKPVVKMPIASQVAGKTPAAFMAVAQFPSADAVEAFFNDADYKPIIETRDRALPTLNVYVTQ